MGGESGLGQASGWAAQGQGWTWARAGLVLVAGLE